MKSASQSRTKALDRAWTLAGLAALLALMCTVGLALTVGAPPSSASTRAAPQDVFDACTPIMEDTTWTTGNVYTATDCNVVVPAGVTLTVQPGVVVKFAGNSSAFIVAGMLDVQGTSADPVAFTSLVDDEHGGDTNEDGASSGAAGDWYGIVFQEGSVGRLEHVFVGYAGSGVLNATLGSGRAQIDVKDADLELRNGEVVSGTMKGIYLEGEGITPSIQSVHVAGNVAEDGRGSAIYQSSINMQPSYADLTFSGNDHNEVTIGRFNYPMTEDAILGGTNYGFDCGSTVCVMDVSTHTLTVMPGTLLDFSSYYGTGDLGSPYGIAVADGGTLIAEGSPTQPITFTSQLAAEGEDLQNWAGLWAQEGSTLRLDHCDISYARSSNSGGGGGLEINTDDAQVRNCHIHHNADNGLVIKGNSDSTLHPTFTDVDVTDNGQRGVYLDAVLVGIDLSLTWDGGSISRNGQAGIESQTWRSDISPSFTDVTVSENGESGIDFSDVDGRIHPVIENVTLANNVGTAMAWYCDGSIEAHNLTATGNGADALETGCDVNGGRQWDLGDVGIPISVTDNINILSGGLLSLGPGTTLRFDKNEYDGATFLKVNTNADLYAVGTADEPIVFTGAEQEPGYWLGIEASYGGAGVVLHHCEIAYGGSTSYPNLWVRGNNDASPSPVSIQNCNIHHSAGRGVRFSYVTETPAFRYNRVHDNAQEGLINEDAPDLDARRNWWGDASGPYHPETNDDGLGDEVGDHVIFYPWLTDPDSGGNIFGRVTLATGSPALFVPGQNTDYPVQYLNTTSTTVENGIVILRLPTLATYVSSTDGGIYWPQRHTVIWSVGNIPPGAHDWLLVTVRYQWGLPAGQKDNVATVLVGDNYNTDLLDVTPYRTYTRLSATQTESLTFAEWEDELAAIPDLNTLYDQALADGYTWATADRVLLSNGDMVVQAIMLQIDRQAVRILYGGEDHSYAATFWPGEYTAEDTDGGLHWNLLSDRRTFFGSWQDLTAQSSATRPLVCLGAGCCLRNCITKVAVTAVAGKLSKVIDGAMTAYDCVQAGRNPTSDAIAKCGGGIAEKMKILPGIGELVGVTECLSQCAGDPNSNDCTEDLVSCEPSYANLYDWVGVPSKTVRRCEGGCYSSKTEYLPCAFGDCCMPGAGCVSDSSSEGSNCKSGSNLPAKDPNAIYGIEGDLLPGQTVTYTITYENVGEGRAYGVYVINPLPDVFDESMLTFVQGDGTYLTNTREIMWFVGELGPKGDPDSEGAITYTVALTEGLASGTVVANQATVVFPSVPEETPTNVWVNVVSPLAALPQNLTTDYATPLSITLRGREISGLPLTYTIVEQPHGGTLTGTLPGLTYTPGEGFTGADSFTFRVSNGVTASRPAAVYVTVTSEGDETPPQVMWTSPAADAEDIVASSTPVFTDTDGPAYAPVVLIGVSEPLSETTVSSATVMLATGGTPVSSSAWFDPDGNQIVLAPRAALDSGEYTATVTTAIADRAGNALSAPYVWQFTVASGSERKIYLPLVVRDA